MESSKELTTMASANKSLNPFSSKEAFEHIQRVAVVFSKSDMVPARYKNNIGNCLIAIEIADRIGASYLMVMQNLDVILGKPGFSSTFLIASINSCGKFSPLRYEEDDKDGGRCRAWAFDKHNGNEKLYGAWVSMKMAKDEGWLDKKGSKWLTMPELMKRYRAASFFSRQYCPEVSMGMHTVEEITDITPFQPANVVVVDGENKEEERIKLMIQDCATAEELDALKPNVPDNLMNDWLDRKEALRTAKISEIATNTTK